MRATLHARGSDGRAAGGSQIVVSPLFKNFSVDEMVAVIQGLKLLSFERGEVILREGQPGGSLYTLTSGRVRAFKKDPATGRQEEAEGPKWGTPEVREFWRPAFDGLREMLAKRGLEKSLMVGVAGDSRPNKDAVEDLKAGMNVVVEYKKEMDKNIAVTIKASAPKGK